MPINDYSWRGPGTHAYELDGPIWWGWVWETHPTIVEQLRFWLLPPSSWDSSGWTYDGIYWPVMLVEQLVILLLGGGVIGMVIRRDRQRAASE